MDVSKTFSWHLISGCNGCRVALWGAGRIGQELLAGLADRGIATAAVFDDYAPPNTSIAGYPVRHGIELKCVRPEVIILATTKARARMKARLAELGYKGLVIELPGNDNDVYAPCELKRVPEIETLRGRHGGEPAFIVGNGPSLERTNPRRVSGAVTIACNNIYLLEGFAPTYYMATDVLLAEDRATAINALPWTKLFPHDLKPWMINGLFFNVCRVPELTEFSEDFALCSQCNFTVTYSMLQFAFFLECDPVCLIGLDHSYSVSAGQAELRDGVLTSSANDPNHFHPDYFGKGFRWHVPRVDQMEAGYRLAKTAFEKHGRRIFNATAGGRLDVFARIDFEKIIQGGRSLRPHTKQWTD